MPARHATSALWILSNRLLRLHNQRCGDTPVSAHKRQQPIYARQCGTPRQNCRVERAVAVEELRSGAAQPGQCSRSQARGPDSGRADQARAEHAAAPLPAGLRSCAALGLPISSLALLARSP